MSSPLSLSTVLLAFAIPPLITLFWLMTSTSPSTAATLSKSSNVLASIIATLASSTPNLSSSVPSASDIRGKRVVLLIAHPDDEAMFFGPTVTQLTNPELGNHVKILCLSTGNAESLGSIRREELYASALRMGVRRQSDVFIVDDPQRFPDSMSKTWSATDIASLLAEAFAPDLTKPSSSSTPATAVNGKARSKQATDTAAPKATIDVLITFDKHGVSGHANHRSLCHGAELFIRLLMRGRSGWRCPVSLYHLESISVVRKYSFIVDAPVTLFLGAVHNLASSIIGPKRNPRPSSSSARGRNIATSNSNLQSVDTPSNVADLDDKPRLLFVANPHEYYTVRAAMTACHRSQMVWFRWGWISLGRYMVVNELFRRDV